MNLLAAVSVKISNQIPEREEKVSLAVWHVKASVTSCNRFPVSKVMPVVGVYSLGYFSTWLLFTHLVLFFSSVPIKLWELFFFPCQSTLMHLLLSFIFTLMFILEFIKYVGSKTSC